MLYRLNVYMLYAELTKPASLIRCAPRRSHTRNLKIGARWKGVTPSVRRRRAVWGGGVTLWGGGGRRAGTTRAKCAGLARV